MMKKRFLLVTIIAVALVLSLLVPVERINAEEVSVEETSIEEQVIFDSDGRKVTVTGYEVGWLGPEISVLVENDTESAFTLQTRDSSVNGIMTDFQASIEVSPGKKAIDSFTILSSDLEDNGIDCVADIELSLHIFDSETYETILDTDPIVITTNLTGVYDQIIDDSGEIVYEEDNIRIVFQGMMEDSLWGMEPMFYIENDSGQSITVYLRNTSVNGIMLAPTFSAEVVSGKKCIDGAIFFSSDLEEKGISEIAEIETTIHIINSETYETVVDTEPIVLHADGKDGYVQEIDESGETIYEEGGIKIVSSGLVEDSLWGMEPFFFIENSSAQPITVYLRDTSVNGFMTDVSFSAEVMPGKVCIEGAILYGNNLEEDITEMEVSLHIINSDTYETIIDTDPIVINF